MHAVEEVLKPSRGHHGLKKGGEEFETWLFDVAILHHRWGTCEKLDLSTREIIGGNVGSAKR